MFLKNRTLSSKIKRSKVTDYAALTKMHSFEQRNSRVIECFISSGMLFQTNASRYDKLFLNTLILGLGIRTFLLLTNRKFKVE